MKMRPASTGLLAVILALVASACAAPNDTVTRPPGSSTPSPTPRLTQQPVQLDNLTVDQASQIIGLPVPEPEYLPPGYAITSVNIKTSNPRIAPYWDIETTISSVSFPQQMTLSSAGFSLGMKLPPGVETVMIGSSKAWVTRTVNGIALTWTDARGRQESLSAGTDLQLDELVKVAQSVTSPPTRAVEITGLGDTPLLVLRGTSQEMAVHLQNNSTKDVDISFTLDKNIANIPSGIKVTIKDEAFKLAPEDQADVTITVAVGAGVASPTFDRPPASSILSTDTPPPFSGGQTEPPSYYLSFQIMCSYLAGTVTLEQRDGTSRQLRIDPPPTLPAGMITLAEAQAASNFPIGLLLPSYLPEGTNPPPLGYSIGELEPHIVTAFYSSFRVELSPEPGVKEPPTGFPGTRDTIRNRPVVIGKGRIDWWADDIHRTVISDSLPMGELRLIAESMMLVGVYSGTWIGMK